MKLQTKIPLQPQKFNQIDYNSKLLLLGSCFSENIGNKFDYFKFQNTINPFGILFHPLAIETLITNAINEKEYTDDDIFFHNEQWHCFDAHSKLSNSSKEEFIQILNSNINLTNQQLHNSTHIIITLGTAWQYRFIEADKVVANCHKVPQKKFLKELLSVDEISESLQAVVALIRNVNNDATIIFTVSPVRHLKDGFVENTQSKAHLIAAIHNIVAPRAQSRGLYYFPSYEIMMDELRDYRFYKEDMIHPNQTAINYIWEAFQNVWISSETSKIMDEVETIQRGLEHRSFNPSSEAHLQFIQRLQAKQAELQSKIPHILF
jgi:hypothetical protein